MFYMQTATLGLYDIYTTHHVPIWSTPYFWYVLALCFSGFIIFCSTIIAFIFYKKSRSIEINSWWDDALDQLEGIRIHKEKNNTDYQKFYDCLTQLLKQYLLRRYGFPIIYATDQEAYECILSTQIETAELISSVLPVFKHGIKAKFAADSIVHSQCENDFFLVHQFITSTKPTHKG